MFGSDLFVFDKFQAYKPMTTPHTDDFSRPELAETIKNPRLPSLRHMSGQLTVLSILVAILPLLCLGGMICFFYDAAYREKSTDLLAEKVLRNAQSLDAFLQEKIANLRQESSAPVEDLGKTSYLRRRLHALQNAYPGVYLGLELIDAQGNTLAQAGLKSSSPDYANAPWLFQAQGRTFFISDLPSAPESEFFAMTRVTLGRQVWLLRAQFEPRQVETKMRAYHPGGAGGAFILGPRGDVQGLSLGTKPPPESTLVTLGQQIFPENKPIILEAPDARGVVHLYACAPLASTEGILVFHQPKNLVLRPLYIARGLVAGVIFLGIVAIVGTIVTMSRRMEKRLQKAEILQQQMQLQVVEAGKLAAIGEMAAGVAHEINNPLAIMMENSGWIQDLLKSEDLQSEENMTEIQESLQTIVTQGHRCKDITHKLLSFARKSDAVARSVALNPLLEDVIGFARQRAKNRGVRLEAKLDPSVPEINASPTEIQQVVLNLVNNAIDAIKHKNGIVRLVSRHDTNSVVIAVEDNGEGIPADQQTHIFEPFFTTKPLGKGTGLGLSICHEIITNLGGTILLESTPGQGSTFTIRLPLGLTK